MGRGGTGMKQTTREHFEAISKLEKQVTRHVKVISSRLQKKLGDSFVSFYQAGGDWFICFEDIGVCHVFATSPSEVAKILALKRDVAITYLKENNG
jgi:hypothetical protein